MLRAKMKEALQDTGTLIVFSENTSRYILEKTMSAED